MARKSNIIGVAYSQRYSNASVVGSQNTGRVPVSSSSRSCLVAVTAWSPSGEAYGRVEVKVISVPTTVTTSTQQASGGSSMKGASSNGSGTLEGFPVGTPSYPVGTVLQLKAITNSNGKFVGWADGVAAATRTVTVTGDVHYVARFISAVQIQNLRLQCLASRGRIQGTGLTEETANNVQVLTRVYNADVSNGDTLSFKAIANEGYHFVRWDVRTGSAVVKGLDLTSPSLTLRMNGSASLEAIFAVDQTDPNDVHTGGGGDTPNPIGYDDPPYDPTEKPEEPNPSDPGAGPGVGSDPSDPGTVVNGSTLAPGGIVDKAKPFVKKWWWAILIVAYFVYKEWKGSMQ